MNDSPSQHPSQQQLGAYSLGRLSADESDAISQHILGCERCCATLDELANQSDGFLQKLKRLSSRRHRSDQSVVELESGESFTEAAPQTRPAPEIDGYEVLDVLGRGGMGVVYRVRQIGLDRLVALKTISAGAQATPEEQVRFRQEAEAVAQLLHPNIVRIYETGTAEGIPYFTMECIEGPSLKDAIAGKPRNPRRSAKLAATLAAAMQSAHEKGIIHRDLKPANVMLLQPVSRSSEEAESWLEHGIPKITDFGLAKRLNEDRDLTQTGTVAGTPGFMAPEQALPTKEGIGIATDVYSIGAILYNLIAGRPPFEADTSIQILNQLVEQDPVSPRALNPSVDRDLETICLKCLEKEPDRRYATAADLADDLNRYVQGKPIRARKVSPAGKLWRWAKRNRRLAAVSAAFMALLVSAAIAGPIVALSYQRLAEAERGAAAEAREAQGRADTQAEQAERQRIMAEREAATSNEVSNFLLGLFDDADPLAWSGRAFGILSEVNPTAIEVLDRGAATLGDHSVLQDQPLVRATLLDKIGTVYLSLGRVDKARPLLTEALELRRENLSIPHVDLASSLHSAGFLHFAAGDVDTAESFFQQARSMRKNLLGDDHPHTLESTVQLGIVYLLPSKRDADGKALLQQALDVYRSRLDRSSQSTAESGRDVQWMFITLAALVYHDLQSGDTLDQLRSVGLIEELQELAGAVPNQDLGGIVVHFIDAEKQRYVGKTMAHVSSLMAKQNVEQAEIKYQQALALGEKTGRRDHYMLAWMRREYGFFLVEQKRFQDAESEFVEAVRVYRKQFRGRNAPHFSHMIYQTAQCVLRGRYQQATTREAKQEIWAEIDRYQAEAVNLGADAPHLTRRQRAIHLLAYAQNLLRATPPRFADAEPCLREAMKIRRELFTQQSSQYLHCAALLLHALTAQEKLDEAEQFIDDLLSNSQKRPWQSKELPILVMVAERLSERGRPAVAMRMLQEASTAGFRDLGRIERSAAFQSLDQRSDFQQLCEQIRRGP